MKRKAIITALGEIEGLMYIQSYEKADEDIEDLKDELRDENSWYDHVLDESLLEGMYGDMLIDRLNVLLRSEGCKAVLDALEEKFGV